MSTPYEHSLTVEIEGAQRNCIVMPMPHRGRLVKLVICDETSAAGFTANVFNSFKACPDGAGDLSSSSSAGSGLPLEHYKVLPTQVAAGQVLEVFEPTGYGYVNADPGASSTNPSKKLYVDIVPVGAGTKTFTVTMTVISAAAL